MSAIGESGEMDNKHEHSHADHFKKLPVTVISGFLGSGKTTLLQYLLQADHGMKIAIIVQDMASVNIDADRARLVKKDAKMVQMENGCICCSLREDLLLEIKSLALEKKFDYLVIESTGVAEPMPVAETFTFGELEGHDHNDQGECISKEGEEENQDDGKAMKVLADIARLDCMVTVMDVKQFFDHLEDDEDIFNKWGDKETIDEENQGKLVCTLLIHQIEFANVILLNKTDLVSKEELEKVEAVVAKLNPVATILKTHYSKVELKSVLNTGLFDFQTAQYHAGWLQELRGEPVSGKRLKKFGINSFVFRSRDPMSGVRFDALLMSNELRKEGVIRAKGNLWLDCADNQITDFDLAGASIQVNSGHQWFIEIKNNEPEMWENLDDELKNGVKKDFHGPHGDKRQELVFIGKNMNKNKIRGLIEACLLTKEEMKGNWKEAVNPFMNEEEHDEGLGEASSDELGDALSNKRKREGAEAEPDPKKRKIDDSADAIEIQG